MKYLALTLLALLGCLALGILATRLLRKACGHPKSLAARIITTLLCSSLVLVGAGALYLGNYYHTCRLSWYRF